MHNRTYLRLRVAAFFAALGVGGLAAFAGGLWVAWSRSGGPADGYVTAGLIGGFALLGLVAWVGYLFDENVARPIMSLARELRARAASDVGSKIDQSPGRYLGQLAPAVDEIHEALTEARNKRDAAIAEHTARIEQDKAFLATLIRELSQAVLVISPAQRVLLFNEAAEALLGPISLDRPVDRFLEMTPLARHISGATDGASHRFLTSTMANTALVAGTVSEIRAGDRQLGFVLVCEAATDRIGTEAATDRRMATLLEQVRRPAMNLGAMLEVLGLEDAPASSDIHARMRDELEGLSCAVSQATGEIAGSFHQAWPRERISVDALLSLAGQDPAVHPAPPVYAQCDAFFVSSLIGLLTDLIACDGERSAPHWKTEHTDHSQVHLSLTWRGKALSQSGLDELLDQTLFAPYSRFTSREALVAMDAAVWLCGGRCVRLELPSAWGEEPIDARLQGRQFFDLGALSGGTARLSNMSFVVFDTETTGLDPEKDDVVQIAGVRVLRSEIQVGDEFNALVNPNRAIPPGSTKIHGITDTMVADAPNLLEVAEAFAAYVDDSVLVAHNASFDRAFLDRIAASGGPRIDTPMLCTAQIAQALDPQINDHTLDAVAERYGVEIEPDVRHSALGDAEATARVFLKMLPVLEHKGLTTINDVVAQQYAS